MRWFGRTKQPGRTLKRKDELRGLPPVQAALMHIDEGGFCEAVIRMLILLAESRGNVRRDRLERSARVLTQDEPFKSLTPDARSFMLQEQTLIVEFAPDQAIGSLPKLLKTREERELASKVVRYIPGAIDEMTPHTLETLQKFHQILDLPPVSEDIKDDPLASENTAEAPKQNSEEVPAAEPKAPVRGGFNGSCTEKSISTEAGRKDPDAAKINHNAQAARCGQQVGRDCRIMEWGVRASRTPHQSPPGLFLEFGSELN